MTPEELECLERNSAMGPVGGFTSRMVASALREAWKERDEARAALADARAKALEEATRACKRVESQAERAAEMFGSTSDLLLARASGAYMCAIEIEALARKDSEKGGE